MAANANRLKNDVLEEEWDIIEGGKEKPKEKEKKPKKLKGFRGKIQSVKNFFGDERTHKITALTLILLSLFFLVAFTSNFFTWKEDQAVRGADSIWKLLFNNNLRVENWLGKLGAITALQFVNNWFGISAFVIPLILFVVGFKILFGFTVLPIGRTIRFSFFTVVWLSTALAFAFRSSEMLVFAGGYGYIINQTLSGVLGFI